MAEKQLTTDEANALSGTTDPATGTRLPSADADPWLPGRNRTDHHLMRIAEATNLLRVYELDDNADAVGVRPGRCTIDGTVYAYAGLEPALDALDDNDTHLIYAEDDGGGDLQIASATDGEGWPATAHLKLAEVTIEDGEITELLDRRGDAILQHQRAAAVADLDQTISDPPTQAEVQAISDKVDALLASLRSAGLLET